jgi:hypothetical protein
MAMRAIHSRSEMRLVKIVFLDGLGRTQGSFGEVVVMTRSVFDHPEVSILEKSSDPPVTVRIADIIFAEFAALNDRADRVSGAFFAPV